MQFDAIDLVRSDTVHAPFSMKYRFACNRIFHKCFLLMCDVTKCTSTYFLEVLDDLSGASVSAALVALRHGKCETLVREVHGNTSPVLKHSSEISLKSPLKRIAEWHNFRSITTHQEDICPRTCVKVCRNLVLVALPLHRRAALVTRLRVRHDNQDGDHNNVQHVWTNSKTSRMRMGGWLASTALLCQTCDEINRCSLSHPSGRPDRLS